MPLEWKIRLHPKHFDVQEVDSWYGSYSIKAILPQLTKLLVTTVLVGVVLLLTRGRPLAQGILLTSLLLLWLLYVSIWVYRIFGYNYRLTNHRVFIEKGILGQHRLLELPLDAIAAVRIDQDGAGKWLGYGDITITTNAEEKLVFQCVTEPRRVHSRIQEMSRLAVEAHARTNL